MVDFILQATCELMSQAHDQIQNIMQPQVITFTR